MSVYPVTLHISAGPGIASQIQAESTQIIGHLRSRLYAMTGFDPKTIRIQYKGQTIENENITIAELTTERDVSLEITGKSEFGDLTDTDSVQKYEMSDAEYDKLHGTVRELKKKMGVPVKGDIVKKEDIKPEGIEKGMRCECELADHSHHRGIVQYVGLVDGTKGYWVGIQLDEPFGKNDGECKGKRYFTCDENFGVFVRAAKVKVGDYPPIDWEKELENEM